MVVTGYEKGSLLDFNYKIEPLPGKFPFPGIGPFDLLGISFSNYIGKMMFRWVYYNLMLKGSHLPLESQFMLAGKVRGILSPDVEIPLRQRSSGMSDEDLILERLARIEEKLDRVSAAGETAGRLCPALGQRRRSGPGPGPAHEPLGQAAH